MDGGNENPPTGGTTNTPPSTSGPPAPGVVQETYEELVERLGPLIATIRATLDPRAIITLCETTGLSSRGSIAVLQERLVRYELRRYEAGRTVGWDPAHDERRPEEPPFSLSLALTQPLYSGVLRDAAIPTPVAHATGAGDDSPPPSRSLVDLLGPERALADYQDPSTMGFESSRLEEGLAAELTPLTAGGQPTCSTGRPPAISRPAAGRPPPATPSATLGRVTFDPQLTYPLNHSSPTGHSTRSAPSYPPINQQPRARAEFPTLSDTRLTRGERHADHWRRWGPKFAGRVGEDAEEFLRALHEFRLGRYMTEDDLMDALHVAFTDDGLTWYRVTHMEWGTYPEFLELFRERYSYTDMDQRLGNDIIARTQGPDEAAADYLTKMRGMYSYLSQPPPIPEQLSRCYRNLHPSVQDFVSMDGVATHRELQRRCMAAEERVRGRAAYRPPPPARMLTVPSMGYESKETRKAGQKVASTEVAYPKGLPVRGEYSRTERAEAPEPLDALQDDRPLPPLLRQMPNFPPRNPDNPGLAARLRDQERTRAARNPKTTSSPKSANGPVIPQTPRPAAEGPRRRGPIPSCYNCGEPGHIQYDCPLPEQLSCGFCGTRKGKENYCVYCAKRRAENASPVGIWVRCEAGRAPPLAGLETVVTTPPPGSR